MRFRHLLYPALIVLTTAAAMAQAPPDVPTEVVVAPLERPDDPYVAVPPNKRRSSPAARPTRGGHVSVQVNVDGNGNNIIGDAANEPSLAVDPTDPRRVVVGWRQFDSISSNFRQAGWGHSSDGGQTWAGGVIEPGVFRSDPVLGFDATGDFYYLSLEVDAQTFATQTFRSTDSGATWESSVEALGSDKAWLDVDRSTSIGRGHIYSAWAFGGTNPLSLTRSTNSGASYETPQIVPQSPIFGTVAVGPDGEVYVAGRLSSNSATFAVAKSTTLRDAAQAIAFDGAVRVNFGGSQGLSTGPNPAGLLGQVWVAVDASSGPRRGHVYLLSSIDPPGADPLDVHFVRSTNGGQTWSTPLRVDDDPGTTGWQWFATLSVAPNGRLDAIWNDSRDDPGGFDSVLRYATSSDGGLSWSASEALTPAFDPHLGWPQQNKLGDYYHMVSDNEGAHIIYAATFNGEQDVYYLRLRVEAIFRDGFESGDVSAWSAAVP